MVSASSSTYLQADICVCVGRAPRLPLQCYHRNVTYRPSSSHQSGGDLCKLPVGLQCCGTAAVVVVVVVVVVAIAVAGECENLPNQNAPLWST